MNIRVFEKDGIRGYHSQSEAYLKEERPAFQLEEYTHCPLGCPTRWITIITVMILHDIFGDKINGMDSQGTRFIDVISHKGVDTKFRLSEGSVHIRPHTVSR